MVFAVGEEGKSGAAAKGATSEEKGGATGGRQELAVFPLLSWYHASWDDEPNLPPGDTRSTRTKYAHLLLSSAGLEEPSGNCIDKRIIGRVSLVCCFETQRFASSFSCSGGGGEGGAAVGRN